MDELNQKLMPLKKLKRYIELNKYDLIWYLNKTQVSLTAVAGRIQSRFQDDFDELYLEYQGECFNAPV